MQNVLATLAFYVKYPGWHEARMMDRATARAINALRRSGYLERSTETPSLFRWTGKAGPLQSK